MAYKTIINGGNENAVLVWKTKERSCTRACDCKRGSQKTDGCNKTEYDDYRVEEYDTDDIKLFDDGRKLYQVWKRDNGAVMVYEEEPCYQDDFTMNKVKRYNIKNPKSIQYSVYVMAEDEEHAEKIGADLIAEYMARKAYIT